MENIKTEQLKSNHNVLSSQASRIFYDFEVQSNIYSITAFFKQQKTFVIYYYLDPTYNKQIDHQKLKNDVLKKAHKINDLTLQTYQKELGNDLKVDVQELTLSKLQHIFEKPNHYVIGFNSNYYDLPIASYLLQKAEHVNLDHSLPDPEDVRLLSNILINGQNEINSSPGLMKLCNILEIDPKRRQSFFAIAKLYDSKINLVNRIYNFRKRRSVSKQLDLLIRDQQARVLGDCPNLYRKYYELNNTPRHIGMQLDMKLLNEKDKDTSTMYTSLKRISAQLGFQIEEPDEVDLSSNKPLTYHQIINLLAYNMSDVIVTTLIFQTDTYQNVLINRENLIKRFNKTNFLDRLNENSTSAKFVENVIAPFKRLQDQDTINLFYPVHDHAFDKVQAKINQDYQNKLVADVNPDELKLFYEFNNQQKEVYKNASLTQKYQFATKYPQAFNKKLHNFFYEKIEKREIKFSYLRNQSDRDWLYQHEFNTFKQKYMDYLNPAVADLNKLDKKWTQYLQTLPEFKPKLSRWAEPGDKPIQRFRVRYGEIQEDLLEKMAHSFKKFPKETYQLYNVFRNSKSTYDEFGNIVKTARDNAIEAYVKKYSLGIDHLNRAIPPKHVHFKYRKDKSVKGISVIVQVPNQPMCLVYSIGGVHGEVIKQDYYEKHAKAVDFYNNALQKIQSIYPDATDLVKAIMNQTLDPRLLWLKTDSALTYHRKADFSNFQGFITLSHFNKKDIANHTIKAKYKKFYKEINPKDYVIPIDMTDPVHVDVDSLYPSLIINLHLFSTWLTKYYEANNEEFEKTHKRGHWDDLYAVLRAERVRLKKTALSVPKAEWKEKQFHQWQIQLIDKLILNSASGIADGSRDTNVRINNKAASMRIMGQLALTYLVYSVEPKGAYSVSTNTDGVYLTSRDPKFSEKEIHEEIENWKYYFHLGATPEIMVRFISKDANNRFEQGMTDGKVDRGTPAGGTIGNAFGANANKKMSQPFVIDSAIVHYFKTHKNICTTYDIDTKSIYDYLKKQQDIILKATEYTDKVRNAMLSFCWPIQPKKHQIYMIKNALWYEKIQHVNRILLVKHNFGQKLIGLEICEARNSRGNMVDYNPELTQVCLNKHMIDPTSTKVAKSVKISSFDPNWRIKRVNLDLKAYFIDPIAKIIWQNLDLKAYTDLTKNKILGTGEPVWVEPHFDKLVVNNLPEKITEAINENKFLKTEK